MKETIFIVDDNLPFLIQGINYPVGGATVQAFSWYKGFSATANVKSISAISDPRFGKCNSIVTIKHTVPNLFGFIRKLYQINKMVKQNKPSIIFVTVAGLNAFIWGVICKLNRVYYIQRISNDITYETRIYKKKLGFVKYYLSKFGINFSNLVLCQNETQVLNLKNVVNPRRVYKIYNPFYNSYEFPSVVPEKKYVSWIGLFQYQKNLALLYNIAKEFPMYEFKIAGTSIRNPDAETKEALINLKTLKNVTFVGLLNRRDIFSFLANAKCLLNTSRYEGFSNTFLEAFSTNTPVITTNSIDPDGIIKKYNLGITCPNEFDLNSGVQSIMELNTLQIVNNFKTRDYLYQNHNSEIIASKVYSIYLKNKNHG